MHKLAGLFLILTLFSCSQGSQPPAAKLSRTQGWLDNLATQYVAAYSSAPNDIQREEIRTVFQQRLHSYLRDTARMFMDSMMVKVEEVQAGSQDMRLELSDANTVYHYSPSYSSADVMHLDATFQRVRGLQVGSQQLMALMYLGQCKVNAVGDGDLFEITAMPSIKK